jgi:radical SAM superfamily enzyme YgiQ (UPF0313 family)
MKKKQDFKVLLISVKEKLTNMGCENPPLGLLNIAGYLVAKDVIPKKNIKIIDTYYDDPITEIRKFKPNLVGISTITPFYLLARKYATIIKNEFPEVKIILGGSHISSDSTVLDLPFDLGVIGEGEETFLEIIEYFQKNFVSREKDLKAIPGIIFRTKKRKTVLTLKRPLITNLDSIPILDWSFLPRARTFFDQTILSRNSYISCKSVSLYTSRGCPYHCTFCAYNNVWGMSKVRFFSTKYFGESIYKWYWEEGVEAFCILDDTFATTKNRVKELIEELRQKQLLGKIYFYKIFIRANLVDEEMSRLLEILGVTSVFIGIESGSQKVLDFLKKKSLRLTEVRKCIKLLGDRDIKVMGSFMFFSPGEGRADIKKTVKFIKWFAKQRNAIDVNVCITTPYPGTEIWEMEETKLLSVDRERYLKLVQIKSDNQQEEIFYLNRLTKEECLKIWRKVVKISSNLEKKWLLIQNKSRYVDKVKSLWNKVGVFLKS